MNKLLKALLWGIGALIALLVAAAVALPLIVDPNDYRDDLIRLVRQETGRELRIEGKLSWSVFPRLGIATGRLELANAAGFGPQPFARVEGAGVRVEWLPLLTGRVRVDTLYVDGLALHLAKDAKGRSNWDDLARGREPPATKPAPTPAGTKQLPLDMFSAGKLAIRSASFSWDDQAAGAHYAARDLTLTTGPIAANAPVDVKLALTLEHGTPARRLPLSLNAQLQYAEDRLAVSKLQLAVDDSRVTGSAEIRNLQAPAYRIDLALDQLDLDRYLPAASAQATTAKPAAGSPATETKLPFDALRGLDVQGKLAIGQLKAFGVRAEDLRMQVQARGGLLELGPNTARLYGGSYNGRSRVDARGASPQLTLNEQLSKVQLGPLLKDAKLFAKFSGEAELKLALTAQGDEIERLKRTLNGTVAVSARDGKIEGVNLAKVIDDAKRLRDTVRGKSVEVPAAPADETAFTRLATNLTLKNGVASTNDLTLEGPVLRARGQGSADLVNETLDFRLQATFAAGSEHKGTTVPLKIGGTFAQPRFGVELGEAAKARLEQAVGAQTEKAGQSLEKKLEEKLDKLRKRR